MIAVIFELTANDGRGDDYFALAGDLRALLGGIDGFLSVERYQSLAEPGRYLSLSFWRDEAAVGAWRNTTGHRAAQAAGRAGILKDYRLRVAEVTRDYGLLNRAETPADSRDFHAAAPGKL
ncbi:MAG: antibiotic biosynthesis monooxygenase [Hyphomonas sp.]|uniref:antibiotic biosynthesis monooxygenase family protein n=1 Tax=Hyphomonas sp. TaxID=87 RepID=UPI0017B0CB5E|nr:antibiotic biosynthesis monooxygenase [Hyphomonas sp.]MBU3921894.1 antibiotic biosynthesis monooxygenase [Alphaproteobacteria bacterium]MBA3069592.1 antibiotic biosynthesis monooxygenase [Hyphomonas sp.]MBU4063247.1 antibiotic biosynthesis monooxygenase [Alphaproteobacteria bacterium]MBU4164065.1 antibiotic biosynthesis monooxygenase [Alphaproteobacteria bacterium]MBU4569294.1 antibiotic biosynthesis monooxygenase [Alphaproteobacteria bacterium]